MAAPTILSAVLRQYDQAVRDWLGTTITWEGSAIPRVIATPDRAFAVFAALLGRSDRVVPLPFMSLYRGAPTVMMDRFNNHPLRNLGFTDSTEKYRRTANWPFPINIPYTVTIWTRNINHTNEIETMLMQQFRGIELFLTVNIDGVPGDVGVYREKLLPLRFRGIVDRSQLEPGVQDRALRHDLNLEAWGWVWKEPARVRRVEHLVIELMETSHKDMTTGLELLETYKKDAS